MDSFAATRRSLHGLAELLIAGPQFRDLGTIRLKVSGDGVEGAKLGVRITADSLISDRGPTSLTGTYASLAAKAGIRAGAPTGLYHDTSGVDLGESVEVNMNDAAVILGWFAEGQRALNIFAPSAEPVLWPEHFDLGITLDEVNYGISPGDSYSPRPYAYIGPWTTREGDFWNAPFGAARTIDVLPTADAIADFFAQGQRLAHA
ncbi:hypothetical protein [Smaragdicoccus niigatensis]|uniref:hypothetical protein n=1 Tax=Smaragdicoccus niigatensis TaxID=359359 RepID=UPI000365E956|nr:hypothetical protein [Smaragdicoccus niigatensis]